MMKKIKNAILDCAIWIVNTIGTPFMKALDMMVEREDEVKAKKSPPSQSTYFTTTTGLSQPRLTISSSGNPGIGTSTINPYLYSNFNSNPLPFSMSFNWKDKTRTITLENGEDILKLVDAMAILMKINNIPFKITES